MKIKLKSSSTLVAVLITFGSLVGGANAAVIYSPTAVHSNTMGDYNGDFLITSTIDQSGLSTTFTSGVTEYTSYISSAPTVVFALGETWYSASGSPTGTVIYDLGSSLNVTRIALWSADSNSASINSATWSISDDATFSSGVSTLGTVSYPAFSTSAPETAIDSDVTDGTGRYLRLTINSNHGLNFSGFNEIAVAVEAVPEPSSTLLLGLGALGFVARRRRTA